EVIQIVEERQLCWVRPLALADAPNEADPQVQAAIPCTIKCALYDLRQGVDLLYPLSLFRSALDTEVVPVLMALDSPEPQTEENGITSLDLSQIAHRQLQTFLRHLWQAHPEAFQF
ncbi:MAG: hypothetical protein HC772_16505, partial [Leptolyngbyaceae cyanobacterium CRU_2_3]|nr:hypothetical protein [Leptolyngbyaceae cyanobacterium CRU_2_3]